jgi:hypothetical protein
MAGKPKTIEDYLATLSDDKGHSLEKPRKTIEAATPKGLQVRAMFHLTSDV